MAEDMYMIIDLGKLYKFSANYFEERKTMTGVIQ